MKKYQNNEKINVLIIGGGMSPEHTISVVSSSSVAAHLDRKKYNVHVVGIGRDNGEWRYYGDSKFHTDKGSMDTYELRSDGWKPVVIRPGADPVFYYMENDSARPIHVDVVFPVVHGEKCEDGTLQGLIEDLGLPIAGCNTLASAIGMDKDISKKLASAGSVPVVPWTSYTRDDKIDVEGIVSEFGLPVFVKPSSTGSSVGITKVKSKDTLAAAIKEAFRFSEMVMVEKAVHAREIEFAILGRWDKEIRVSIPGEIVPLKEFYTYEAKYVDAKGADLIVPANIDDKTKAKLSEYAAKVFKALRCSGMARADFFIDKTTGEVFFNEINTIPGFTTISMYPRLWGESGIPYDKLLDELVRIALEE